MSGAAALVLDAPPGEWREPSGVAWACRRVSSRLPADPLLAALYGAQGRMHDGREIGRADRLRIAAVLFEPHRAAPAVPMLERAAPPREAAPVGVSAPAANAVFEEPPVDVAGEISPAEAAEAAPAPRVRLSTPSVPRIVEAVAQHFAVPRQAIFAATRENRAVRARQVAWWLARRLLKRSYPKLGRSFCRDHSSIVYGVQIVDALRERDADFAASLDELERAIRLRRPAEGAAPPVRLRKIAP